MAEIGLYPFHHSEAQLYADLIVVSRDMQLALECLMPIADDSAYKVPGEIRFACWTAAIVRYARAFNSGVLRWPKEDALASLSLGGREVHDYFMDLRNGFVAHSVGTMDYPVPVVQIRTEADGTHEIQAVTSAIGYVSALGPELMTDFRTLIIEMLESVKKMMRAEANRLLGIAKAAGPDGFVAAGIWQSQASSVAPRKARSLVGDRK